MELLVASHWPGNIRQLYNVVRQNVALSPTRVDLGGAGAQALGEQANALPSFSEARDEFTRNYLSQILQITGGNVSQAARLAKRNRTDFYKLLGRHQLNAEQFKDGGSATCTRNGEALRTGFSDRRRHLMPRPARADASKSARAWGLLRARLGRSLRLIDRRGSRIRHEVVERRPRDAEQLGRSGDVTAAIAPAPAGSHASPRSGVRRAGSGSAGSSRRCKPEVVGRHEFAFGHDDARP